MFILPVTIPIGEYLMCYAKAFCVVVSLLFSFVASAEPVTTNGTWAWNTQFQYNTQPDFYLPTEPVDSLQAWKCNSYLSVYNAPQHNSMYSCNNGKARIEALSEVNAGFGGGQCVSFVKLMANHYVPTSAWIKGSQITPSSVHSLQPNTVIATFRGNRYDYRGHTAIYLFSIGDAIVVLDQNWRKDGTVAMHTIRFKSSTPTWNDFTNAYAYYVVNK